MLKYARNLFLFGALITLVSLWDLIALGSIYNQKKYIEENFTIVIEANNYIK